MRKQNKIQLEDIKDKSTLVKLLAEEDLTVSYKKVPTAHFDLNTREVVLPIWKDKSESVMDMMSLHEVGHALYTPLDLVKKGHDKKVKHSFLNVLEDVRIEKMIQDKYLGSKNIFKKAYDELLEKDFFNIQGKDLSKLNLIDRINMHYKHVPDVPFEDNELEWVDKANKTKTVDDVLNLAVELQAWMKENQKDITDEMFNIDLESSPINDGENDGDDKSDEQNSGEDSTEGTDSKDVSEDDTTDDDSDGNSEGESKSDSEKMKEALDELEKTLRKGADGDEDFEGIESVTQGNFMKSQENAVDNDAEEIEHINIPKINIKEAIVDYKTVNSELTSFYDFKCKGNRNNTEYLDWIKYDVKKFEKEQAPTISYMVKEFEMRKAADLYKRSTVSKTGTLNMDKLHSYSYNEDVFLKMTNLPGATNHGLVMFVDWSGSMYDNMFNTIKQTMNLVWFCKRVNIPFEVYAFTNYYGRREDTNKNIQVQKRKHNDMVVSSCTLLNLLSSRANKSDLQEGLNNLWAMGHYFNEYRGCNGLVDPRTDKPLWPIYIKSEYHLGSTPLNHSLVYAMDILPKFKKDNGLQKVHTVYLTDGASDTIDTKYEWGSDYEHPWDSDKKPEGYEGELLRKSIRGINKSVITDPVTKKKHLMDRTKTANRFRYYYGENQTEVLIEFLKARVPGMTITNFYIAGRNRKGSIQGSEIQRIFGYGWEDSHKVKSIQKEIKKNNVAVCKTQAWDELYLLPGGERLDVSNDDLSEIQPGAAKKDLKKAFGKMTSGRKNSRPLLNKFIGMIA